MSTHPPSINIKSAFLKYSNEVLFADLNFTLPAGKITCLLGQSGIGKSSLLRLIADITANETNKKQSAEITASDRISPENRIAYMAQTDLLLPWLNIIDNILIGYRLRNENVTAEVSKKAEHILQNIGLKNSSQKYPQQLSGGMRQRVALARTLMENKPIVLMDEPFSALDTITRLELQNLTAQLLKNKTVLLVTHDPLEALRLGDHIVVMTGKPAVLTKIIDLAQPPPREITDPTLLKLQAEILNLLLKKYTHL